ncbi:MULTISPECIES: DUF3226 domain-containing protein [Spirulina sp. CCY15215]|uniref:DUF3226 domain-containing protein n=1 Tax=Spirulina sp. CCY15215 TaxID=2767591 RepID=UPI0019509BDB|nr:DUF3226 domain-containing protein [Spirulina major]
MSNILIVESENDKFFLQALVDELKYDIQIEEPICLELEYECLEGLSKTRMIKALKELEADIQKRDIQKIGIVIDIDDFSQEKRLEWLQECLDEVFPQISKLVNTGEFIKLETKSEETIKLACYFTNVDGNGELDTVLKEIKSKDSSHADCLIDWKNCIESQDRKISDKDFDKFWVAIYLRYDTCSRKEQKQAARKCSFEYSMKEKKEIWNFTHPLLNDLKEFLSLFAEVD